MNSFSDKTTQSVRNPPAKSHRDEKDYSLYQAYMFLPQKSLSDSIKRMENVPKKVKSNWGTKDAFWKISNEQFAEYLAPCYTNMVWRCLAEECGLNRYAGVYSTDNPIYQLCNKFLNLWIAMLTEYGYISSDASAKNPTNDSFGSFEIAYEAFYKIVPIVLDNYNLRPVIECIKENTCEEDFSPYRSSYQKIDHHRKWYHTRAKLKTIPLEGTFEEGLDDPFNQPDFRMNISEYVSFKVTAEQFMDTLEERDLQILKLRMNSYTTAEVASAMDFQTHSAVIKRMDRLARSYAILVGKDYHIETYLKEKYREKFLRSLPKS